MIELTSAGLVVFTIVNGHRHYLLLHYPHGHWDLVKGKLEAGETKKQAAIRELQEETGLSAAIIEGFERSFSYNLTHQGKPAHKTVSFFIAQALTANVRLSHEHTDFAWLLYEQAVARLSFDNAQNLLVEAERFLGEL